MTKEGKTMTPELERIEKEVLKTYGDGDEFLDHIDDALREAGYIKSYTVPCYCPEEGEHGHHWACGWIKKP